MHPVSAVQVEYNPWTRDIEGESGTNLLETCKELSAAVVAYSILGRGVLTGAYRSATSFSGEGDFRARLARFSEENMTKNEACLDKIAALAERKGCTSTQVSLAWLIAQAGNVFVIPGTKKIKYLEEDLRAASWVLTKEEDQEFRRIVTEADIGGDREPMFGSYVDTIPLV